MRSLCAPYSELGRGVVFSSRSSRTLSLVNAARRAGQEDRSRHVVAWPCQIATREGPAVRSMPAVQARATAAELFIAPLPAHQSNAHAVRLLA